MPTVMDYDATRLSGQVWLEKFSSHNPEFQKQALSNAEEFTRRNIREEGILRKMMPFQPITNDDLDRTLRPTELVKYVDLEPDSPAATQLPFAAQPEILYMRLKRYPAHFNRIGTRKFTVDVDEFRTNYIDARTVISDNSIKDMLAEEDAGYVRGMNAAMVAPDIVAPASGTVQWRRVHGNLNRDTLIEGFKIVPSSSGNLDTAMILMNNLTCADLGKMSFNEFGGPGSADLLLRGWTSDEIRGKKLHVTIKKALVPTNSIFYVADQKFVGKCFMLEDVTLSIKAEDFMIYFFAYELVSSVIGNTAGVGRMDLI